MHIMHIIGIILIGFFAGLLARWFSPAPNNPSGFIMTCLLGIAGAFLATYVGHLIGWYHANEGARLIGATIGAIVVLLIWRAVIGSGEDVGPAASGPRRWL